MAFNLFSKKPESKKDYLTEEIKTKTTPPRGKGGRFVSTKKKAEPIKEKSVNLKPLPKEEAPPSTVPTTTPSEKTTEATSQQPTVSSFYGKPVRRFYHQKKWYFTIDDIIALAAADSLNQKINLGDERKLEEARREIAVEFSYSDNFGDHTVETATALELIDMMLYVRGIYPGPFRRWITETSQFPAPVKPPAPPNTEVSDN